MRIGELSTRTGVSVRSLRYYEQEGLLESRRTAGGQRVYTAEHLAVVEQIRELLGAGFCSAVIRELLPALHAPSSDRRRIEAAFDAAEARLESERSAIDAELRALSRLRGEFAVAPDTHVRVQSEEHDSAPAAPPASFDHRDRRLR